MFHVVQHLSLTLFVKFHRILQVTFTATTNKSLIHQDCALGNSRVDQSNSPVAAPASNRPSVSLGRRSAIRRDHLVPYDRAVRLIQVSSCQQRTSCMREETQLTPTNRTTHLCMVSVGREQCAMWLSPITDHMHHYTLHAWNTLGESAEEFLHLCVTAYDTVV